MPGVSELERGRSEAAHTQLIKTDVTRFIGPSPNASIPLIYAFHLLGNLAGKTVLDLGCGSGENIAPLLANRAKVIAVDISAELIEKARERLALTGQENEPTFIEASAYEVPLPNASVDAILCASLLHHLDIPKAMAEMRRLLKPDGIVIVKEPVRFSTVFGKLRSLFPDQQDISEDEHPLTREEYVTMQQGWKVSGERAFRLPTVPLGLKIFGWNNRFKVWNFDAQVLRRLNFLRHFATSRVLKLEK